MKYDEKITALRLMKGLTQQELADKLKVPVENVEKWEKGQNIPTPGLINKMIILFGVDENFFEKDAYSEFETASLHEVSSQNRKTSYMFLGMGIILLLVSLILILLSINSDGFLAIIIGLIAAFAACFCFYRYSRLKK